MTLRAPPLLERKFHPQLGARVPLARGRLGLPPALCAGGARVAVVMAPAGYGKSTLLAQWFAAVKDADGAAAAWLNLDENDNDPLRLLRYLVAALSSAVPGLQDDGDGAFDFNGPVTAQTLLEALSEKLGGLNQPLILFVDDAHLLTQPAAVAVFDWLVRYAALRFVIGCRAAPQIGLAELRLRGQLVEVGQAALAFTFAEAADFCRQRLAREIDAGALAALVEKTEGWAAVLELLTLALNEAADAQQLIVDFSATERGVVDYLGEVVFGRVDGARRQDLQRLAQFDSFCAELVAASMPGVAADFLDEIKRRSLFLIPLDRQGKWFRFHHLVRDYLRQQGGQADGADPERRAALRAGAAWLHAQGMTDDAIDCAVRAQAWELACQWLAESAEDMTQRMGAGGGLSRWMRLIPAEQLDRYPLIRVSHVFSLVFLREHEQMERELTHLEALIERGGREGSLGRAALDELRCAVTLQRLMCAGLQDEGVNILADTEAWLARWQDARARFRGDALNVAAYACKVHGEIERGLDYAAQGRAVQAGDGSYYGASWSALITALLHMKRGDYRAAGEVSEAGLRLVAEKLGGHPEHAAFHHAVLGAVHYEFDDAARAAQELEFELAAVDAAGIADFIILMHLTQARMQFLAGQRAAGLEALRLGRKLGQRHQLPRINVTLAGEECVWLCRQGEHGQALELARQFGFDRAIFSGYDVVADKAARVGPRLLLASAPAIAVAQLGPALVRCTEKGFHHRRVELLLLQAISLLRSGREEDALGAWRTALELGERCGYRRVFLDDAEIIATLAQAARNARHPPPPAWLRPRRAAAADEEALTHKEQRILKHLESGRANREIAASLFISEGTLKWHLHNIYRKLACKNRSGALTAARQAGLL